MHERSVPACPPPRRRRLGAALQENSYQLRMILVHRFVQSGLGDSRMLFDHLDRGFDFATMADPHHLVFELAPRCRWRCALGADRTRPAARGRLEKRGDLMKLTVARAGERSVVADLIPQFAGPSFRQRIRTSVEEQPNHLDATGPHRIVQRLKVRVLGAGKGRVARQHSTHGFFVATIHGGEKRPGITSPKWLVENSRTLKLLDVLIEPGPARESVIPGEHELRVGKRDSLVGDGARVMSGKALYGIAIVVAVVSQQLFSLLAELLQ